MRKIINGIFLGIIVLFLLLGLVNTLFFPDDINLLENRYANKVGKLSIESYQDGSFQKQFRDALNDQVLLQGTMKKTYNTLTSSYENTILLKALSGIDDRYISFKGGRLFGDYIVYSPYNLVDIKKSLDNKVKNISSQVRAHKDIDFYVYYIEKDTDINLETNQKTGVYEYLEKEFGKQEIPFSGFKVQDFSEFEKNFFKTDHHWNCRGSYLGYVSVLELLGKKTDVLQVKREMLLDYSFSGSKAKTIGATELFKEKFPVYEFDYPLMDIKIDGQVVKDYGKQLLYMSETQPSISYGDYYGWDNGEIVFDTYNTTKENLLVIGESYDNAILKLVASHFSKTYSIDLRNYESFLGEKFSFSKYVTEHEIDKVLLIGNIDYFTMEEFMLED